MGGTSIHPFTDFGVKKLFAEEADEANFNRDDQRAYQDSSKYYRDMKNLLDTMYEEGLEEGRQQGIEQGRQQLMIELAQTMRARQLSDEIISSLTGLT